MDRAKPRLRTSAHGRSFSAAFASFLPARGAFGAGPLGPRVRRSAHPLRDHPLLVGLVCAGAALEALIVGLAGPRGAVALAPQVVAPAPFGVFHDLRWLIVYHPSWAAFAIEALAFLVFRTALDAVLVRAAWPAEVAAPSPRELAANTARFTAVQAVMLLPFAVLSFSMAVTSLSWLFFVVVGMLTMVASIVHHGAVDGSWWRNAPTRTSVVATFATFVVLTIAGGVLAIAPDGLAPLVAAGAGIPIAACHLRIVSSLAGRELQPRRRPFAVVGIAVVTAILVVGTTVGFAVSVAVEAERSPLALASSDAEGPPVLVVKGFNSRWEGVTRQWVRGGYRIRRFSYRGLDGAREPRPYGRADTHRSVRELAREMRDQVEAFYEATGERVSIVAESEGSLVAQAFLAGTPDPPVRAVVLLSPLLAPGRVFYPRGGESGWGAVAGTAMDTIAAALGAVGPVDVSADTPLFRSMVEAEPVLRSLVTCPPQGVRSFAVLPLDSGLGAPAPFDVAIRHAFVPAFHGGLLGDATTAELVGRVLRGEMPVGSAFWLFAGEVVNAGAAAWQVPSLEVSLEPGWATRSDDSCRSVRAEMRGWLDG